MRKHPCPTAVAAMLVLASCGGGPPSGTPEKPADAPRAVRAQAAGAAPLPGPGTVPGTLDAEDTVALGFEVDGRIGEMLVALGDRVRAGQPLARLQPTDFDLRVRQAAAALEQARARLGLDPGENAADVDPATTSVA